MSERDEGLDSQIEELRRRIDYQIEENSRLEDMAGLLLRITLATIGLLVATAPLFISRESVDSQSIEYLLKIVVSEINSLYDAYESSGFVGQQQADFIILVLIGAHVFVFFSSVRHLFYNLLRNALDVIEPQVYEPTANFRPPASDREILDQYKQVAIQNEKKLIQTRQAWSKCYENLINGLRQFLIAGVIAFVLLILQNPDVTTLVFLAVIGYGFYLGSRELQNLYSTPVLSWNPWIETGIIFLTAYVWASGYPRDYIPSSDLLTITAIALSTILILKGGFDQNYTENSALVFRNGMLLYGGGLLIGSLDLLFRDGYATDHWLVDDVGFALLLSAIINSAVLLGLAAAQLSSDKVSSLAVERGYWDKIVDVAISLKNRYHNWTSDESTSPRE